MQKEIICLKSAILAKRDLLRVDELQRVAVSCSELQRVAVSCSELQ